MAEESSAMEKSGMEQVLVIKFIQKVFFLQSFIYANSLTLLLLSVLFTQCSFVAQHILLFRHYRKREPCSLNEQMKTNEYAERV